MSFNFVIPEFNIGGAGTPALQFFRRGFVLGGEGGSPTPTWRDVILSGNTALTLVNAKADGLNYLKLFGGCSQAGTPTPTTPVDIVCNNGALKVLRNMWNMNSPNMSKSAPGFNTASATVSSDGVLTITNNSGNSASRIILTFTAANLGLVDGKTYTLKVWAVGDNGFSTSRNNSITVNGSTYVFTQVSPKTLTWTQTGGNNVQVGAIYFQNYAIGDTASIRIQVSEGESIGDYLPYGQSVVYTDGTVETVQITGKNIFNKNNLTRINAYIPSTNGNWTYTASGYSVRIPCLPNTTYTARYNGNSEQAVLSFASTSSNDVPTSGSNVAVTSSIRQNSPTINTPITITTGASDKWLIVAYNAAEIQNADMADNLQIELGSTATTYEAYTNLGTATAENLLAAGTYKDVQSVLDGAVTRNVGVKVLNGTEDWRTSGSNAYQFLTDDMLSGSFNSGFCTHFSIISNATSYGIRLGASNSRIYAYVVSQYATVTDWTNFLSSQYNAGTPVIVVYPLATATTESVTAQELTIQEGTNIVEITQASMNGLELEVSYKAGVTVTVEEVEAAQLDDDVTVTVS